MGTLHLVAAGTGTEVTWSHASWNACLAVRQSLDKQQTKARGPWLFDVAQNGLRVLPGHYALMSCARDATFSFMPRTDRVP